MMGYKLDRLAVLVVDDNKKLNGMFREDGKRRG